MTGAELLETYPKAAVAIKEFYYGKMIESLEEDNDIPQEFKDMVQAQIEAEKNKKRIGF